MFLKKLQTRQTVIGGNNVIMLVPQTKRYQRFNCGVILYNQDFQISVFLRSIAPYQ